MRTIEIFVVAPSIRDYDRDMGNESNIKSGRVSAGMTFNEKVWAMTARIPSGKVATYGDIARALKSPRAARAVGNALNRNPFSPQVPCHRVVGSDGSLTGFAGGIDKKRLMLRREGIPVRNGKAELTSRRATLS